MKLKQKIREFLFRKLFPDKLNEIECGQSYIAVLESRDKEHKRMIQLLKEKDSMNSKVNYALSKRETKNVPMIVKNQSPTPFQKYLMNVAQSELMMHLEGWIECCKYLPRESLSEVIVTNGQIVSTVGYDHPTKSFVKVFGSQTMRVPLPKMWRMMPIAPDAANVNYYVPPSPMSVHEFVPTYIR